MHFRPTAKSATANASPRHYKAKPLTAEQDARLSAFVGDKMPELNRITQLFAQWNTVQLELLATIYAVWNDLLIDKANASETAIIDGVKNWSAEKAKKYTRPQIAEGIMALQQNNLVPWGFGEKTQELPPGLFDSEGD